jgi:L-ribulokinase
MVSWPLQLASRRAIEMNDAALAALVEETMLEILPALGKAAETIDPATATEISVDWFNGRRTPDANQELTGSIAGLRLASNAPEVFRAVAEATCFGARAIVDRFVNEGIPVKGLIGLGGVAKKSTYIMQMMADIINMPIRIHRSEQTCALGASMFAATAAGIYGKVEEAMLAIGQGFDITYTPNAARNSIYEKRYLQYKQLGAMTENLSRS